MALDLDQLPLTFSNEENVKLERGGRGCAIWALAIVCLLVDLLVGFNTKVPINSLRFWAGMCVAPALGSLFLFPVLKPSNAQRRTIVIDKDGVKKTSGTLQVNYDWDQLRGAEVQKEIHTGGKVVTSTNFLKLIRVDAPEFVHDNLDAIEDIYGVDLNELAGLINQGVKEWGRAGPV